MKTYDQLIKQAEDSPFATEMDTEVHEMRCYISKKISYLKEEECDLLDEVSLRKKLLTLDSMRRSHPELFDLWEEAQAAAKNAEELHEKLVAKGFTMGVKVPKFD